MADVRGYRERPVQYSSKAGWKANACQVKGGWNLAISFKGKKSDFVRALRAAYRNIQTSARVWSAATGVAALCSSVE